MALWFRTCGQGGRLAFLLEPCLMRHARLLASFGLLCLILAGCEDSADRPPPNYVPASSSRNGASYGDYIGGRYGSSTGYINPGDCWRSSSLAACQ